MPKRKDAAIRSENSRTSARIACDCRTDGRAAVRLEPRVTRYVSGGNFVMLCEAINWGYFKAEIHFEKVFRLLHCMQQVVLADHSLNRPAEIQKASNKSAGH